MRLNLAAKTAAVLGSTALVLSVGSVHSSPAGAGGSARLADAGVTVTGSLTAGSTLTAVPASWTPQPDARTYEWLRDGEDAVMGRGTTYTVVPDDIGHTVVVVERITSGSQRDETSFATAVVGSGAAPRQQLTTPSATLSGTGKVGATLRVVVGGVPAGASSSVQWLRDGSPISGATAASYTLVKADGGRTVTARATASAAGAAASSDSTAIRVRAFSAKRPTVRGTAKVGKRLTVRSKGTWFAAGHSYRYQWLRNGKTIAGATKSSYKVTSKDRRKQISVRVTARKAGFPSVAASSARTKKVR